MVTKAPAAHLVMVLDWVVVRSCEDVASLGWGPAEMAPNWTQEPAWDPFRTQSWDATKGFCRGFVTMVTDPSSLAAIQAHCSVTMVTREILLAAMLLPG